MRGQQQVLTSILLVGVLVVVVGSVYLWGVPLIQKNRDVALLKGVESFIFRLDELIREVANTHGKEYIRITPPCSVRFYPERNEITATIKTRGTIYAVGRVYFVRNESEIGSWGRDEPAVMYVDVKEVGDLYSQKYVIKYRKLEAPTRSYLIKLVGSEFVAGEGHTIYLSYAGSKEVGRETWSLIAVKAE